MGGGRGGGGRALTIGDQEEAAEGEEHRAIALWRVGRGDGGAEAGEEILARGVVGEGFEVGARGGCAIHSTMASGW